MKALSQPGLFTTVLFFGAFITPLAFGQGPLTPPGAPAPAMKALDELEPRINVQRTINPLPSDGSDQYIINQPGSYYLSGNLNGVSGKNGVLIQADNVTLDLNGFAVVGGAGTMTGIVVSATKNVCIRNGIVRGWNAFGVNAINASNALLERLLASDNAFGGLVGGSASVIKDCVTRNNGGHGISCSTGVAISGCISSANSAEGIDTGTDCAITGCLVENNQSYGINPFHGCVIKDCVVSNNLNLGITASYQNLLIIGCVAKGNTGGGIAIGPGSTIKNCVASANVTSGNGITAGNGCTIQDCTATANFNIGISAGSSCSLENCTASANGANGIAVNKDCRVINNTSNSNTGEGITTLAGFCRIDGNHVMENTGIGVHTNASQDVVIRNTARNNFPHDDGAGHIIFTNYSINDPNNFGPTGTTASAATSPWANL